MSDTDIYKQREPLPHGGRAPKKKRRRRRSESSRRFDEPKKRRGKNSGIRRLLHLSRKGENEKYFWTFLAVTLISLVVIVGVWQFFFLERAIRSEEEEDDYIVHQRDVPKSSELLTPRSPAPAE